MLTMNYERLLGRVNRMYPEGERSSATSLGLLVDILIPEFSCRFFAAGDQK
jgi:hypothetical protein